MLTNRWATLRQSTQMRHITRPESSSTSALNWISYGHSSSSHGQSSSSYGQSSSSRGGGESSSSQYGPSGYKAQNSYSGYTRPEGESLNCEWDLCLWKETSRAHAKTINGEEIGVGLFWPLRTKTVKDG